MEEKSNTRFNEVRRIAYVLGARKRDFFIDLIINTIASITLEEDSTLYLYPRNPRTIGF